MLNSNLFPRSIDQRRGIYTLRIKLKQQRKHRHFWRSQINLWEWKSSWCSAMRTWSLRLPTCKHKCTSKWNRTWSENQITIVCKSKEASLRNNVDQTFRGTRQWPCEVSEDELKTWPTFDGNGAAALISTSFTGCHTHIISTVLYRTRLDIQSRDWAVAWHCESVVRTDFFTVFKPRDGNDGAALELAGQTEWLSRFQEVWRLELHCKCWGFCKFTGTSTVKKRG